MTWNRMRILSRATLREFWRKHPDAEGPLKAWFAEVSKSEWKTMIDIKRGIPADALIGRERAA
jgi:mRNA interferase HigB